MSEILGWVIGAMLAFAAICVALWVPLIIYRLILRTKKNG